MNGPGALAPSEPRLSTPTERALYRDCVKLKEERDRYRVALRAIAGYGPHNPPDYFDRDDMRQIARGALDA